MPFPHFRYNTLSRLAQLAPFAGRLRQAIQDYPESNAVLVRRHGVYVWGKDWIQAKTQAECYDYLFEAALRMKSLGINASLPQAHAPLQNSLANGHGKESAPLCPSHAERMLFVDVSWLQRVQDVFGDEQKHSCQSCCSRAAFACASAGVREGITKVQGEAIASHRSCLCINMVSSCRRRPSQQEGKAGPGDGRAAQGSGAGH